MAFDDAAAEGLGDGVGGDEAEALEAGARSGEELQALGLLEPGAD